MTLETEETTVPEAAAAVAMGAGQPAGEVARAAAAGAAPEKGSLAAPVVPQEAVETGT